MLLSGLALWSRPVNLQKPLQNKKSTGHDDLPIYIPLKMTLFQVCPSHSFNPFCILSFFFFLDTSDHLILVLTPFCPSFHPQLSGARTCSRHPFSSSSQGVCDWNVLCMTLCKYIYTKTYIDMRARTHTHSGTLTPDAASAYVSLVWFGCKLNLGWIWQTHIVTQEHTQDWISWNRLNHFGQFVRNLKTYTFVYIHK